MSLQERYVNALRQSARSASEPLYVCIYCNKQRSITGRENFFAHLESLHVENARKDANFDLTSWRRDAETQSRTAVGSSASGIEPDELKNTPGQSDNTHHLKQLSLESNTEPKRRQTRRIAPKSDPPVDQGHKRPRSLDNQQSRSGNRQAKGHQNVRRAPKDEPAGQLQRAGTFQSNWAQGEPTRQLFNPADDSAVATAGQVTLPSRSVGPPSTDPKQQSPSVTATASTQPAQSNSERGVLPMPTNLGTQNAPKERVIPMPVDARWPDMLLQPDSRPISQEQLAAEVKSIYAGLTMVESKCIHVDKAQALAMREGETRISNDHWQALIALHRTLLHEHHDFFLASQHPSASPALRRLASKYSMPARMWKHGIHSFLELLRFRLPHSLEFMISFIYTAYQMMSLLYETVPAFKNTWIECLGDLGRYRMAIEDEDVRDRENWANVSRFWYTKAADRSPEVGRLYHHLAILARPNALQQLSLYSRSLISVQVFNSARESILTLFSPILGRPETVSSHMSQLDSHFVKLHAILFTKEHLQDFKQSHNGFIDLLDQHISRITAKWREQGAWMMIALLGALFDYGNDSPLRRAFELGFHKLEQQARTTSQTGQPASFDPQQPKTIDGDTVMEDLNPTTTVDKETQVAFDSALELYTGVVTLVLQRQGDKNVLPFVHILLAFLLSLAKLRPLDAQIESAYVVKTILAGVPLQVLCSFLNTLARSDSAKARYDVDAFVQPEKGDVIRLPEDHLIRGQVWSQDYFPTDFFKSGGSDDEEKNIEHASTVRMRSERVLNLGYRLSLNNFGIRFDAGTKTFSCDSVPTAVKDSGLPPTAEISMPLSATSDDLLMSGSQFRETDSAYESDEDSPENKVLKKLGRGRRPTQADRLAVPPETTEDADDILKNGVTYMVCDEQFMLYNQDVFQMLVQRKWKIVVPNKVFHELSTMSATGSPDDAKNAREALEQVRVAYARTELKILDAKGTDVTKQHFDSSNPPEMSFGDQSMKDAEDPEEDTIGVARSATELSLGAKKAALGVDSSSKARPAILLSEDRRTRLRATKEKIAALAPSVLKVFLEATVTRRRSLSRGSSGNVQEPKATSPISVDRPRTPLDTPAEDTMETSQ